MPSLSELRAQRITSILTEGLLSAEELKRRGYYDLGSVDPKPLDVVCKQYIQPYSAYPNKEQYFEDVFYRGGGAVFPVIIERKGDIRFSLASTFITQDDVKEFEERAKASFVVIGDAPRLESGQKRIPVQNFASLFFPEHIWQEYLGTHLSRPSLNMAIKIVTGSVERRINDYPYLSTVPNYETPISGEIESAGKMYWLHAVRLPVAKDLKVIAA